MSDAVAAPAAPAASASSAPVESSAPVADAAAPETAAEAPIAKGAVRGPDGKFAPKVAPEKSAEEPKAPEKRKFKLKVDGNEEDWEGTDEDIVRHLQKASAAEKRFQEAAQARKEASEQRAQVNKVLDLLQNDPRGFAEQAKAFGVDPVKFAQEILMPVIEEQIAAEQAKTMTPEQREAADLKKRVAEYERRDAERTKAEEESKKTRADQERQATVQKHVQSYEQQIISAIEESGLPKSAALAEEVAAVLFDALDRGLELTTRDVVAELHGRKTAEMHALLEKLDDGAIDRFIPKAVQERLRKAEVAKFKATNPMLKSKPVVSEKPSEKPQQRAMSMAALARDLSLGKFGT